MSTNHQPTLEDPLTGNWSPPPAELSPNKFILNDGDASGNPSTLSVDDEDGDAFVYPGSAAESDQSEPTALRAQTANPSPAQLESLCAAASSGDLDQLKRMFKTAVEANNSQPFGLANDTSTRTGFTVLHAAASRGHLDIVQWLIDDCGAMPDVEDREGETAVHKAALHGHIEILKYLLPEKADVHARDADGWTALHNACSKGYLDVVRWLCEKGGATALNEGTPGVDVRSKDGWTPLMNAASKGHLPVVLYLLNKQSANPLVRNKWGETAYDVAAAVFEVWICEVLQQSEATCWRHATTPYNPLLVHTTLPIILYENQRLDTRLKTVAVSGGRPKFSTSGLGKQGRPAPFQLKLLTEDETGSRIITAWRSGIVLPARESPWVLPKPSSTTSDSSTAFEATERSHFWLSDWTLDVTHPAVDAENGWQYAQSFADPDERWVAEKPMQLQRILNGSGVVAAGFSTASSSPLSQTSRAHPVWVRRRRWVRIMRRRLDMPPLPFLEPDGAMYYLDPDGALIPYTEEPLNNLGASQELELVAPAAMVASARDYVARARYLVGNHSLSQDVVDSTSIEVRRSIAKLERATMELREGLLDDDDAERRVQAEVLLNAYSRELERRRTAASSSGLRITDLTIDDVEEAQGDDDDDDTDSFVYPNPGGTGSRSQSRSQSRPQSRSSDYFGVPGSSRIPADLTPQLAQAPDFRVPTHEAPQKVAIPRWTSPPTAHQLNAQWERDEAVSHCRECQRRFNFINRRHCRKCGRIFCDRCSSNRIHLDPSDVVHDPSVPPTTSTAPQRVCQGCYDEVYADVPSRLYNSNGATLERVVVDHERLTVPGSLTRRQSSSQLSDLADCPVCYQNMDDIGGPQEQEAHVRGCLDGSNGSPPQGAKYLVYRLPAESTLLGVECVICLEEFVKGSMVARLSCFCSFHSACLSSWLQRGKSCPVHAR